MNLSTPEYALPDYLCRFAVRVPRYRPPPGGTPYCQVRLGTRTSLRPSAPTPFNALFRQRAEVSLLRHRVARGGSHGMLTVSAIALAIRLRLRTRLTPG